MTQPLSRWSSVSGHLKVSLVMITIAGLMAMLCATAFAFIDVDEEGNFFLNVKSATVDVDGDGNFFLRSLKLAKNGSSNNTSNASNSQDINSDGAMDLIWHNQTNGKVAYWFLSSDGSRNDSGAVSTNTLSSSWQIRGFADINRDGIGDLVWHNQSNGKCAYWFLNSDGSRNSSGAVSTNTLSSDWQIKAFGDINKDTTADLVWHNQNNGKAAYWFLNSDGSRNSSGAVSTNTLSSSWQIKAYGDINGDDVIDLVWHNQTNGKAAYWMLSSDGSRNASGAVSTNTLSSSWQIKGFGNINNDGILDFVWHNQTNGKCAYWFLNSDGSRNSSGAVSTNTLSSSWQVKAAGDINGDSIIDLVWHNQSNGKAAYWFLNSDGSRNDSGAVSTNTLNSTWQIMNNGGL